jgi:hypothetical protein
MPDKCLRFLTNTIRRQVIGRSPSAAKPRERVPHGLIKLVINLRTAKALGRTTGRDFLLIADEVIG